MQLGDMVTVALPNSVAWFVTAAAATHPGLLVDDPRIDRRARYARPRYPSMVTGNLTIGFLRTRVGVR